jgi:hypothetical protein
MFTVFHVIFKFAKILHNCKAIITVVVSKCDANNELSYLK